MSWASSEHALGYRVAVSLSCQCEMSCSGEPGSGVGQSPHDIGTGGQQCMWGGKDGLLVLDQGTSGAWILRMAGCSPRGRTLCLFTIS